MSNSTTDENENCQTTEVDDQLAKLKAANLRLTRSEARTKAIIHSITDGVAVANKDGKLELFNAAAEEILGIGLTEEDPEKWTTIYGLYLGDGETPCPTEKVPLVRAVSGERVKNFEGYS